MRAQQSWNYLLVYPLFLEALLRDDNEGDDGNDFLACTFSQAGRRTKGIIGRARDEEEKGSSFFRRLSGWVIARESVYSLVEYLSLVISRELNILKSLANSSRVSVIYAHT